MKLLRTIDVNSSAVWRDEKSRGAIALMTVIIMGAILLVVGITASFVGQTDTIIVGQMDRGRYTRELAMTCAGEALHRLKLDSAYTGGTVQLGGDSCAVTVTGTGSSRSIVSSATHFSHTRTITISASLNQNASQKAHAWKIDSWQETGP